MSQGCRLQFVKLPTTPSRRQFEFDAAGDDDDPTLIGVGRAINIDDMAAANWTQADFVL